MKNFGYSINRITSVLIRPGSMVRVHHGPFSISSNAQLVYHDLIARGREVETARRWHSLVQRFEACCGVKDSYNRADVVTFVAELQRNFELLAMEINRTKRITNALEYIVIPGLQVTIHYLNMKFEERDREEKARLKRVKVLVARE
jgi:hypothetical protein